MADLDEYKSEYLGQQVDTAVGKTLAAVKPVTIEGVTSQIITVPYGAITGTLSNQADLQATFDTKQDTLTAGAGIVINDNVISSTSSAPTWGSIEGVLSTQTDLQSALDAKQNVLTAGSNIQIANNTISATDTTYTAGANIQISDSNVISSVDTTYIAGSNIHISDQNVISATYTAGSGISITNSVISSNNDHALKSYLDEGELLTDAEGLADVEYYNRSTFDLGKFTVVGSLTITADGIASGFSVDNYLYSSERLDLSKNFKLEIKNIYFSNINASIGICQLQGNVNSNINVNWGDFRAFFSDGTNSVSAITSQGLNEDLKTSLSVEVKDDLLTITAKQENGVVLTKSVDISSLDMTKYSNTRLMIGKTIDGWYGNKISTIDLKQFSITVDDKEVFNGNKSGIDQIKANDYTVVGSPTITDDGIASGFSASNSISFSASISSSTNVDYILRNVILSDDTGTRQYKVIFGPEASNSAKIGYITPNRMVQLYNGSSWTGSSYQLTLGTSYDFKLNWNGTSYTLYAKESLETEWVQTCDYTTSSNVLTGNLFLGRNYSNTAEFLSGSLNLNSFKIYVDGSLAYQPTLRIPYNHTKTGSKIVQSVYRDRVEDMAEQFGYAPYYTLEKGTNFTVPQGDLYGLMKVVSEQNELVQNIIPISTNTISLMNNKSIYSKTISANTTFTFDVSGLGTLTNKAVTFELYLDMSSTVYTLTFPNTVTWIETPDFTTAGKYLLVFRSMDGGSSYLGNLECQW